jgi:hypothetical protein
MQSCVMQTTPSQIYPRTKYTQTTRKFFQMKLPCARGIAAAAAAGRLGQNMMPWLAESVHPGYHLVRYAAVLAQATVQLVDTTSLAPDGETLPDTPAQRPAASASTCQSGPHFPRNPTSHPHMGIVTEDYRHCSPQNHPHAKLLLLHHRLSLARRFSIQQSVPRCIGRG